jgi:MFS superfamily sulfate permease-like transporter
VLTISHKATSVVCVVFDGCSLGVIFSIFISYFVFVLFMFDPSHEVVFVKAKQKIS